MEPTSTDKDNMELLGRVGKEFYGLIVYHKLKDADVTAVLVSLLAGHIRTSENPEKYLKFAIARLTKVVGMLEKGSPEADTQKLLH